MHGEIFSLKDLAEDSADDGMYEFFIYAQDIERVPGVDVSRSIIRPWFLSVM